MNLEVRRGAVPEGPSVEGLDRVRRELALFELRSEEPEEVEYERLVGAAELSSELLVRRVEEVHENGVRDELQPAEGESGVLDRLDLV